MLVRLLLMSDRDEMEQRINKCTICYRDHASGVEFENIVRQRHLTETTRVLSRKGLIGRWTRRRFPVEPLEVVGEVQNIVEGTTGITAHQKAQVGEMLQFRKV